LSNTAIWLTHIVAGIIGVILSVSVFYQKLESAFSVHQKLSDKNVDKIVNQEGKILSREEREKFIYFYNSLVFIGRTERRAIDWENATTIHLKSGIRLQMVAGEQFYEVRRIQKNGKEKYFRLYEKR
jgi:hypothetical protein